MAKINKITKIRPLMYLVVIIGSIIVAFGNTVFLTPLDINAGGLNGLGIIVMNFCSESTKMIAYNVVIYALSIGLWALGYFLIGREFALKTLISTIVFPFATSLFTIIPGTKDFAEGITKVLLNYSAEPTIGTYLLFSLIGGVIVGFGVAITFIGGGSTGGVDVLTFIFEKYLNIKQSVASFFIDGTIVMLGLLILCPINAEKYLLPCLVGILSAAVTALMINIIYEVFQTVYQVDVISEHWEKVSKFAQDELGRGATIIPVKGGYKEQERIMVRIVLNKGQYDELKEYISSIDDRAFITITTTKAVLGEGFKANKKHGK
ncbi:MAG: YitT family protein [Bacilli bacterium]|nr:YitT family protein [Bacilli bacterium]